MLESVTGATLALLGAVLFLLLAGAGWLAFVGLRARGQARATAAESARLQAMLRTAPVLAATVTADGRVDMPVRMADWLGLSAPPEFLGDLGTGREGLDPEDARALAHDINGARLARRTNCWSSARSR